MQLNKIDCEIIANNKNKNNENNSVRKFVNDRGEIQLWKNKWERVNLAPLKNLINSVNTRNLISLVI